MTAAGSRDLRRWARLIREARKVAAGNGAMSDDFHDAVKAAAVARPAVGGATLDNVFIRLARAGRELGKTNTAPAWARSLLSELAAECAALMPPRFDTGKPPEPGSPPKPYYLRDD